MLDFGGFQDWWAKKKISSAVRVEFYEAIIILLENNTNLNKSLQKMYDEYSAHGKKPNRAEALLVYSCLQVVQRGEKLTRGLRGWIPEQELALLDAGEESGRLIVSLNECVRLISVKNRIIAAIIKAVSYPTVLGGLMSYMLSIVALQLMPKMSKISNPETWTGNGKLLADLAWVVSNYGIYIIAAAMLVVMLFFVSLPRASTLFNGGLRVFLDGVPPWSLYRIMLGATFLLNVSLLLKSGIRLQKALSILARNASPWLRQRIDAVNSCVSNGNSFGAALRLAGYGFPDNRAIAYLVILGDADGLEEVLNNFANRWIEKSIKYIDAIANVMLICGLVVIGCLMGVVLLGSNDIASQISQSQSRH